MTALHIASTIFFLGVVPTIIIYAISRTYSSNRRA
jgi:hypothetical protein